MLNLWCGSLSLFGRFPTFSGENNLVSLRVEITMGEGSFLEHIPANWVCVVSTHIQAITVNTYTQFYARWHVQNILFTPPFLSSNGCVIITPASKHWWSSIMFRTDSFCSPQEQIRSLILPGSIHRCRDDPEQREKYEKLMAMKRHHRRFGKVGNLADLQYLVNPVSETLLIVILL